MTAGKGIEVETSIAIVVTLLVFVVVTRGKEVVGSKVTIGVVENKVVVFIEGYGVDVEVEILGTTVVVLISLTIQKSSSL